MSFISPLLQTTRNPLWIHPLAWSPTHLHHLRIIITEIPTHQEPPPPHSLPPGSIPLTELTFIHQIQKFLILETYLPTFLERTISTFQPTPSIFRFKSSHSLPTPPTSILTFGTTLTKLPATQITHTVHGLPFLLYNTPSTTTAFRTSRLPTSLKKRLHTLTPHPFYAAGLISLAQTQLALLQLYELPLPEVLKVYLITPCETGVGVEVEVYTAGFTVGYLEALRDPWVVNTDEVVVTRERVGIPIPEEGDVRECRLLDVLAGALEGVCRLERRVEEARREMRREREKEVKREREKKMERKGERERRRVEKRKAEKRKNSREFMKTPKRLLPKKEDWRRIRGVLSRIGRRRDVRFMHKGGFKRRNDLKVLDYVSSLRPVVS